MKHTLLLMTLALLLTACGDMVEPKTPREPPPEDDPLCMRGDTQPRCLSDTSYVQCNNHLEDRSTVYECRLCIDGPGGMTMRDCVEVEE